MKLFIKILVILALSVTKVYAASGNFSNPTLNLTPNTECSLSTWTFTQLIPNGGGGIGSFGINAGALVTINLGGTTADLTTVTLAGSSFAGNPIASFITQTANTITFSAPATVGKGTTFSIVLANVSNVNAGTVTTHNVSANNNSAGTTSANYTSNIAASAPPVFTAQSVALSASDISNPSSYTFTQTNPSNLVCDYGISAGSLITINLPAGNMLTAIPVGSSFNGAAITLFTSQTANTITFNAPVAVASGATFSIVIANITNPVVGGSYAGNISAVNNKGTITTGNPYNYFITSSSPPLAFIIANNQPADKVYGQPNFTTNTATTTQVGADNSYHTAVDPGTGKVFISDLGNNRILRYPNIDAFQNGEAAEAVLGQPNFTSNAPGLSASNLNNPVGIFLGPTGSLWVCDYLNHRVLRFDNASFKNTGDPADGVLGQTNFTSNVAAATANNMNRPIACFEENDGTFWVCDQANDRLLRFDNAVAKANGGAADGVLGQTNFTNNVGGVSQTQFDAPTGVSVNNAGRLYLSDQFNDRIIWFDNAKGKANGGPADGYLGQPNFTTGTFGLSRSEFNNTRMVTVSPDNKFLAVSDAANNRIMIFLNPGDILGEVDADFVFGQPDFVSNVANNGGVSASSIFNSRGVYLYQTISRETYLFVSDRGNSRTKLYLLFDIFETTDAFSPIVDQFNFTEVDGDILNFAIVDSSGLTGSINIDNPLTGDYTYTPKVEPFDYEDTVIYSVCDKDGCDTSVVIFRVLTPKRLWLRADIGASGTTLSAIENYSSPGDSIYAFTGGEPTLVNGALNYNPNITFDGSSSRMYLNGGIINTVNPVHTSIFAVSSPFTQKNQHILEETPVSGTFGIIDLWSDGNAYFEAGTALENPIPWGGTLSVPYIWSHLQSNTFEEISRDAQLLTSSGGGSQEGDGDTTLFGYDDAGNFYDGDIAEIILFQHSLGETFLNGEINTVESYLGIKYGITLNQTVDNDNDGTIGTDYTLSDTLSTAWEDSDNVGYNNDIAGIGRDDFYALNQKQSKSINADAIIAMGLDDIYSTNQLNPSAFPKDSIAFVWGNDNGSLANWNFAEKPKGYNKMFRIEREWKVEENLGDVGLVHLEVLSSDLPAVPFAGNNLFVVIDEDGNGDFTDGDLRLYRMSNIAGTWETKAQFEDGEVFTLAYVQFDFMRHGKYFYNKKENEYHWINRKP